MSVQKEKVLSSRMVYQGGFLKVVQDLVEDQEGHKRRREYVLHPGASLVIPVLPNGKFVMERQYRHAVKKVFIEFPAGKLDAGEEPLAAAKRELKEETGYEGSEWKHLGTIHPCIGYSDEFIEVYLCKGLVQGGASPDAGEHVEVFEMSSTELDELVKKGEITDAKTLSALALYEKNR